MFDKSTLTSPLKHSSEPDTREPNLVDTVVFLEPLSWSQLHLIVLQQAFIKQLLNHLVIQILSNEDKLLASISPWPFLMITVET